jgi:hypothetical protein
MLEHSGAVALVTLDSFRGREFLDALRSLYPELDGSPPGALKSARLLRPQLGNRRAVRSRFRRGFCKPILEAPHHRQEILLARRVIADANGGR